MNEITDTPNEYDFGQDFNYGLWTPGTQITLASVPWGNDYRDVIDGGKDAVNTYIDSLDGQTIEFNEMTYIAPNTPVRIPLPVNAVNGYNYLRVRNPITPISGDVQQDYFYFILDVVRKNPTTTEIIVQLDVWATYRHRVRFNRAFVERGHVAVANADANTDNGRKWLTTPEGFDTGSEYQIVSQDNAWNSPFASGYVLITSVTDLVDDPGTVENPSMGTSQGGYVQAVSTPTKTFAIKWGDVGAYFTAMRNYPWVTQGIVKVVVVPKLDDLGYAFSPQPRHNNYPPGAPGSSSSYLLNMIGYTLKKSIPFSVKNAKLQAIDTLPERYRHLTKFTVSPYMFIELSNFAGSSMTYRPELFKYEDGQAFIGISLVPGSERFEFIPDHYNTSVFGAGESYDAAVVTGNLPNLPVVNDMAISALASSAHGRNAARQAAEWSQQIALDANANAYDGAALSASTSLGNDAIMRNLSDTVMGIDHAAAQRNNTFDALGSIVGGAGAGGAVGGLAGAGLGSAAGMGNAAMQTARMYRNQETDRSRLSAVNNAGASVSTRNYNTATTINESNKGLADRAARGNYEQAIGAMNARVQDTMLTQPGLSGGFGGEFFRYMAEGFVFVRRVRMIEQASIERIGEHWLRYGYALRSFMKLPDSLMVMSKFSYWKASEVYTSAAHIPELYKRVMSGILEKGVTVWENPRDIGVIDIAENKPKSNVRIER